ncbi:queuine tRNA-ribosyltransferase (tRNA-guanine transglycosylase) (Guanine insertion enzyme) [Tenacibaculum maritimum]|uniref:Queuine tRNA-ribosyltransferase n=3 Tax=Tenacibaculum maritimum TaxID=107401 RepID=A0A2H1E978_9FLAO|nr:queuine tRNA-ribosyltransferase (tRNA-guanine transglycosylase) (Guanine insertion enzyme) [Tenacibaculum maritimum]SFZ81996.1 Queuine tRNA-ribosyltransferase [Tenacibaculum maritimum NCIMB 2154]CAA0162838.1 queuine tRNA-ribosyltransferase (tRNA-guanine transglycosylase) (Guanine insertion enzyme) [Tenacibaculum maritimum]CAA0166149.1 queuine tRNA-ribosyltransferase (tRNA-guanine transglycosylase) (Guanine insertion enzyme) [Tenacibaculum maritimum]CAA0172944.1 queuine tRNA-ribosyltransferas
MPPMQFDLKTKDPKSKARAGVITTDHGTIETPIFMPVGTVGTVKGVHQTELKNEINPDIILGNTYHLYLRPQTSILEQAGGLHKFMNWDRNILTDSGGYQVYSLSGRRKINEEGVKFKSHIDGSTHFFTPESVMEIQRSIGADIIMAFDECTPYPCDYNYAKRSMHMTHRWLKRCVNHLEKTPLKYDYSQTLFPIVQGSTYKDLRKQSAEFIASVGAEGNAIGGLSVGEPAEEMYAMTEVVTAILPEDKPRYLMGVGTPINILENIALGIDMFDCVMPTRNARNGMLFTAHGTINIKNKKWENDFSAIDEMGITFVDTLYSKAYLRHLFASKELLGKQIASIHNLGFYLWLTREARKHILAGDFAVWKDKMVKQMDKRL